MDELLQEIAISLGTTVEHLWGVMVTQAPISSVTFLVTSILMVVALWFSSKYLLGLEKDEYDEFSINAIILWSVWGCIAFFTFIIALSGLNAFIAGIFNPEYWALMQLLEKM